MRPNTLCIRLILFCFICLHANAADSACNFEVLDEELQVTQKQIISKAREIARNGRMSDNPHELVLDAIEKEIPRSNSRTLTNFLTQLIQSKSLSMEHLENVRELTQTLSLSLPDIRVLYQAAKKQSPSDKHAQLDAIFDRPWGTRQWRLENGNLKLSEKVKNFIDSMERTRLSTRNQMEQFLKLKPSAEEYTQLAVHLIENLDYRAKNKKAIIATSVLAPTIIGLPFTIPFWTFENRGRVLMEILSEGSKDIPLEPGHVKAIQQSIIFHAGEKKFATTLYSDWGSKKISRLTLVSNETDTLALPTSQQNPLKLEHSPLSPEVATREESNSDSSPDTSSRLDKLEKRMQAQEKTVGEIRQTLGEVDWKSVSTNLGQLSEVFEKLHSLTKSLADE